MASAPGHGAETRYPGWWSGLLVAQRVDGSQGCGSRGRVDAKEQADGEGEAEGEGNGGGFDDGPESGDLDLADQVAEQDAGDSADHREHDGLEHELEGDVGPAGSDGLADADFAGALGHRRHELPRWPRRRRPSHRLGPQAHIAYVGARLDSTPGGERLAGYLDGLRHADLPVDRSLILPGQFNSDDGRAAVKLLHRDDRPTAIFAACDAVAFGIYDACHEQNIRIPEDVSIVGFDDALGGELVWPHLTTVRQPLTEMGRNAVRACVQAVQGKSYSSPPVELATTLVVRESTARAVAPPVAAAQR